MKSLFYSLICLILVVSVSYSAGTKVSVPFNDNLAFSKANGVIANSRVDTIVVPWNPSLAQQSLAVYFAEDSVSITNAIVRRVVNGVPMAVQVGDTLTAFTSFSATTGASVRTATITTAPLCETYWIILTFAGSANGVTTPTYTAESIRQFYRR